MPMHIVATEIHGQFRVVRPFRLPFHCGSMLRGVFGRALRQTSCARGNAACLAECQAPTACTYARLFDPPVPYPPPHRFLRGQTRAPQPLIPIFPRPGHVDLHENDTLAISIRLLGRLHPGDLDLLSDSLEQMCAFDLGHERGRIALIHAALVGQAETPVLPAAPTQTNHIDIEFETPTWIEHNGQLMTRIAFGLLFRSIYRRLTVLCALYGETDSDDESTFEELDDLANAIVVVSQDVKPVDHWRRSEARQREHPMRGFIGRMRCSGPRLERFIPTLRLAEKTHIGKATSFGFGRIDVDAR